MKKIQRIVILGIIVSFLISSLSTGISFENENIIQESQQVSLTYNFETLQINTKKISNKEFTTVKLEGELISSSSNPSEPVLPTVGCQILLPYGYKLEDIQVDCKNQEYLTVDHPIEPGQNPYPLNYDGEIEYVPPNLDIYNSINKFPNKKYDIVSIQKSRGYNILILKLYPVNYDPLNNRIIFSQTIDVNINTNSVDPSEIDDLHPNFRGLQKDIDKINDLVDNPEIVDSYPGPFPTHTYEYVIITTENLKNYNGGYNFQALRDTKIANGLNAKIVTVEDIYDDYSGYDNQEKIRNFIKYAYNNWDTEYVLLGGDDDVVPAKIVHVIDYQSTDMPSDLYYACLDDPAPSGSGTDDLFAEVFVGRACVGNTNEVSNFVKKTIEYMNAGSDYLGKALWVGEHLGFGGVAEYAKDMKEQNIGHCEADGYTTDGLPESGDEGYNIDRLYDKDNGWGKIDIIGKLNDDVHLLNHLGHGNVDYAMKLHNGDISSLNNDRYFFVYSQTCLAGHFDDADCFAEEITVKSPYAAFAAVMNARYGWGMRESTDGPSQRYDREFWDAIYGEDKATFGWANHDSKEDNYYRINEPCMKWCYYETNLFGDPSLWVKGAGPELEFSPKSYDFGKLREGDVESTTFEIWSSNSMALDYNFVEEYDWLTVTPQSGESNGEHDTITVTVDTSYMSNGLHNADIEIESNGGEGVFHIQLMVGPVLGFEPTYLDFGKMQQGETSTKTFNVWNKGIETLDYSFSTSVDWISINPDSGSSQGEKDAIAVSLDTTGVENGDYTEEIVIQSNGGTGVFQIRVLVGRVLGYSPKSHDFGNVKAGTMVSTQFNIWNRGLGNLDYSLSPNCNWVTISPESGSSAGENDTIIVNVDTQDLSFIGSHTCDIMIDSNGGNGKFSLTVDIIGSFLSMSYDGYIYNKDIDSPLGDGYPGARNSLTGTVEDNQDNIKVGQQQKFIAIDTETGQRIFEWTINRGFLFFDTSGLSEVPDNAIVTDAWLSMYPKDFKANQIFDIILTNGQPDYPHNPMLEEDYYVNNYDEEGGRFSPSEDNVDPNGYNKLYLNEKGKTWINKDGLTKLCLISSMDFQNQPTYGDNYVRVYSGEQIKGPVLNIDFGFKPNEPLNPIPSSGSTDVNTDVELSVDVSSPEGGMLDVYFYSVNKSDHQEADPKKELIGIDYNVDSGKRASVNWSGLDYKTDYNWLVIADNGECSTLSQVWSFTTREENNAPEKPSNPQPEDGAESIILNPTLSVDVSDKDQDNMDVRFYVNDDFVGIDTNVESGTTASLYLAESLESETIYSWYTIALDSKEETESEHWNFKTIKKPSGNHAPEKPSNPNPSDEAESVSIPPQLSVDVFDQDNDKMNVSFYLNDQKIGEDLLVNNGERASIIVDELEYNTTYSWYVVVSDGHLENISDTWEFKTTVEAPNISITIENPLQNSLYFRNKYKFPFFITLAIGKIDITANITGEDKNLVENVKFFVDDELKHTDKTEGYNWTWDKFSFGKHTVLIVAFNTEGKELKRNEITLWKFF